MTLSSAQPNLKSAFCVSSKKKKHPLQYGDVFLLFYLKNHFTFLSTCRDTFAQMCTVLDTQMQKPKPVKSTENYSAPYSKHIDAVHSKSWGLFVREFWVRQRFFIGHQLKYFFGPQESRLRSKYCIKKHNIFVLFYFFLHLKYLILMSSFLNIFSHLHCNFILYF